MNRPFGLRAGQTDTCSKTEQVQIRRPRKLGSRFGGGPLAVLMVVLLNLPLVSRADISFNFSYVSGDHFQSNPTAQTALTDAASTVGGWFNTTATLNVDVTTFSDVGNAVGAAGGIPFPFLNPKIKD